MLGTGTETVYSLFEGTASRRDRRQLQTASVLLAGIGAAGPAAAFYLAAAGSHITLWDPGLVAPQDLACGMAIDQATIGLPRARATAARLRSMDGTFRIDVLDRESDVIGAVPEHTVLLAGSGDWAELLTAAARTGTDAVVYGVRGAVGAVSVFQPGESCPHCLGAAVTRELGLGAEGYMAATACVVGTIAATETVKLILGEGMPLAGRLLCYNGWSGSFRLGSVDPDPGCHSCRG